MTRVKRDPRHMERVMARAWPSFETENLDGWSLRFADGYTKRANSVNPHFGSTLPLEEKIARCETAFGQRGLPTIFRLTPFSQPACLEETLARRGYEVRDPSLVMVATRYLELSFDTLPSHTWRQTRGFLPSINFAVWMTQHRPLIAELLRDQKGRAAMPW